MADWVIDVRVGPTVGRWHGGEYIEIYDEIAVAVGMEGEPKDLINVWDYAAGRPRIAITPDAVRWEVEAYILSPEMKARPKGRGSYEVPVLFWVKGQDEDDAALTLAKILDSVNLADGDPIEKWHTPNHPAACGLDPAEQEIMLIAVPTPDWGVRE